MNVKLGRIAREIATVVAPAALVALGALVAFVALGASPAWAAHAKPAKLVVVVLPVGGGPTDPVKDGLELRLVQSATVKSSDAVAAALKSAGAAGYEPAPLARILAARHVDVLVRRQPAAAGAFVVTVYGKDGLPRLRSKLQLGDDADLAVDALAQALEPALKSWRSLRPLPAATDDDAVDDLALTPLSSAKPAPRVLGAGAAAADDDDATAAAPKAPVRKRHHASIDDDSPSTSSDDDSGESASERKSDGDGDKPKPKHESIDAIEAESKAHPGDKYRHAMVASLGLDLSTWHYGFDGGTAKLQSTAAAPVFPGGSALIDVWPLSFAGIRFIGLDAEIAGGLLPFTLRGSSVSPQEFTSPEIRASAMLKLRYTFDGGVGIGLRAGYRTIIAGSAKQQADVGGVTQDVTVVPAYRLRAFAAGADLFVPVDVGGHVLEIEARAEALPLSTYVEAPDNPGGTSLSFGAFGLLATRYIDTSGLFVEGRVESTAINITFTDQGTRRAFVDGDLVELDGGSAWNVTATATLGAGFVF